MRPCQGPASITAPYRIDTKPPPQIAMHISPDVAEAGAVDRSSVSVKIVGNMIEFMSPTASSAQAAVTPRLLADSVISAIAPAATVASTQPGEMFVHRNIANLVLATDTNLLSVLEYAVRYLEVRHIIVCGHYGCGGVKASLTRNSFGIIDGWLRPLKDTANRHHAELAALPDDDARTDRLVELSVIDQVHNLAKTSVIQRHWQHEQRPHLHGWVYGLHSGRIKPLVDLTPESALDPRYQFDDL